MFNTYQYMLKVLGLIHVELLLFAENTALSSVDPAVLKEAYSAVATFLLEAVKTDQNVDSLRLIQYIFNKTSLVFNGKCRATKTV